MRSDQASMMDAELARSNQLQEQVTRLSGERSKALDELSAMTHESAAAGAPVRRERARARRRADARAQRRRDGSAAARPGGRSQDQGWRAAEPAGRRHAPLVDGRDGRQAEAEHAAAADGGAQRAAVVCRRADAHGAEAARGKGAAGRARGAPLGRRLGHGRAAADDSQRRAELQERSFRIDHLQREVDRLFERNTALEEQIMEAKSASHGSEKVLHASAKEVHGEVHVLMRWISQVLSGGTWPACPTCTAAWSSCSSSWRRCCASLTSCAPRTRKCRAAWPRLWRRRRTSRA